LLSSSITLTIDTLAFGGDGVGRYEAMVVFVPGGLPSEKLEVRVTDRKKNFLRAEILRILEPSPHRLPPPCPYYDQCGGCQYQHLNYATELIWKERQVLEQLSRVARLPESIILPIIPSPEPYGYRNRISVHADEGRVGFHQAGTRNIVDIERCLLASEEVNQQLTALRRSKPQTGHYSLRAANIPISAFFQSNHYLIDRLQRLIVEAAQECSGIMVEGYAGGGFFTGALASQFSKVIAIEEDTRALRDATQLQLTQVEWVNGRVEDYFEAALHKLSSPPDLILVDPPRTGLGRTISEAIAQSQARRIVYVSCDPSTMARDAGFLKIGYRLASLQPIDMFPRTAQIETVSVWEVKEKIS